MKDEEKNDLIVEQQLKIRRLEKISSEYEKRLKEINSLLVCCGGPLNDNFDKYNKDQLKIFFNIDNLSRQDYYNEP